MTAFRLHVWLAAPTAESLESEKTRAHCSSSPNFKIDHRVGSYCYRISRLLAIYEEKRTHISLKHFLAPRPTLSLEMISRIRISPAFLPPWSHENICVSISQSLRVVHNVLLL
ncbi:hypothetical protein C8R44DRAFT_991029, partial [Mycena epipterygia]